MRTLLMEQSFRIIKKLGLFLAVIILALTCAANGAHLAIADEVVITTADEVVIATADEVVIATADEVVIATVDGMVVTTADEVKFAGGSGTIEDPYQVATAEQLNKIREIKTENNYMKRHYIQIADIDLADFINIIENENENDNSFGWLPIGQIEPDEQGQVNAFTGSYDGNGYLIKNLYINRPDMDDVGLFAILKKPLNNDAIIKNINLQNANIIGNSRVGAILGNNESGMVEGCAVTGTIIGKKNNVGGLVGYNSAKIKDSYVYVNITAGSVDADGNKVGGYNIGGLVGLHYPTGAKMTNCYAVAIINNINKRVDTVGGLVGNISNGTKKSDVINSFYDKDVYGEHVLESDEKGIAKTTEAMKEKNTYIVVNNADGGETLLEGWDFEHIWAIDESNVDFVDRINYGYPYLRIMQREVAEGQTPNEEKPNEQTPGEQVPNEEESNEQAPNEEAPDEQAPDDIIAAVSVSYTDYDLYFDIDTKTLQLLSYSDKVFDLDAIGIRELIADIEAAFGKAAIDRLTIEIDSVNAVKLSSETLYDLIENNIYIKLQTSKASYTLPLSLLADSVDKGINATINIEINDVDNTEINDVDNIEINDVSNLEFEVYNPVDFRVYVTDLAETVEIDTFAGYVMRELLVPDIISDESLDDNYMGIILEKSSHNGEGNYEFFYIPTKFVFENEAWRAKIFSMTNSIYAIAPLIDKKFADINFSNSSDKVVGNEPVDNVYKIINTLAGKKIIEGYQIDGQYYFLPDKQATYAEFIAVLTRALGLYQIENSCLNSSYLDDSCLVDDYSKSSNWYDKYISLAKYNGIIKEHDDMIDSNTYGYRLAITKDEAADIIEKLPINNIAKASIIGDIIGNMIGNYISPGIEVGLITRGEMALIVYDIIKAIVEE